MKALNCVVSHPCSEKETNDNQWFDFAHTHG